MAYMYLSHLSWKEQLQSPGQRSCQESPSPGKLKSKVRSKPFSHKSSESLPPPTPDAASSDVRADVTDAPDDGSPKAPPAETQRIVVAEDQSEEVLQTETSWPSTDKASCDWPSPKKEEEDPWAAGNETESFDFWAVEKKPSSNVNQGGSNTVDVSKTKDSAKPSVSVDTGVKSSDPNLIISVKGDQATGQTTCSESDRQDNVHETSVKVETVSTEISTTTSCRPVETSPICNVRGNPSSDTQVSDPSSQSDAVPSDKAGAVCDQSKTTRGDSSPVLSQEEAVKQEEGGKVKGVDSSLQSEKPQQQLDPLCQEEDLGGTLCVFDDSDESEKEEEGQEGENTDPRWIPTQKLDPHPLHECLQLTFEEAFFLSYGLGCLVVQDERKEPLDLTQLWQTFCARRKGFITTYIAYHSLRSKGWVPKTGIKYGADFIIYHKGPAYYHGSYSVLVRCAHEPDLRDDLDPANPTLTWASLMGADRVTETVGKDPLILLVIKPRDLTESELTSPNCVRRFKVQEMLLRRWVSSREREAQEAAEWL